MERKQVLDAARAVATAAAAHADETEAGRRLAPAVVEAIDGSGLNRLIAPRVLGGLAYDPVTMAEVIIAVARADASTGWCLGIGMGSNFMAGIVPESGARQVFTTVDRGGCGPFAPGGRAVADGDGLRISGRWPYSSNCQQALTAGAGYMEFVDNKPVMNPSGLPDIRLAFFTRGQFTIDETWNTLGMRGTGSHDIVVTDVAIDRDRTCSLFDPMWPDDALFRMRSFDILPTVLCVVPLAIGRAALDALYEKAVADAAGPPSFGPRPRFADDPHVQRAVGQAETRLRAAQAMLFDGLNTSYELALLGDTAPRAVTAAIGLANCEALKAGKQAVATVTNALGSASVREGGPIGRLQRDIDTAGAHILFAPSIEANLARELAGIPTACYPYLPEP